MLLPKLSDRKILSHPCVWRLSNFDEVIRSCKNWKSVFGVFYIYYELFDSLLLILLVLFLRRFININIFLILLNALILGLGHHDFETVVVHNVFKQLHGLRFFYAAEHQICSVGVTNVSKGKTKYLLHFRFNWLCKSIVFVGDNCYRHKVLLDLISIVLRAHIIPVVRCSLLNGRELFRFRLLQLFQACNEALFDFRYPEN